MKKLFAAGALALLGTFPATAETGAQLLQNDQTFGMGFVWGATNYMTEDYALNQDDLNRLTMHRANCLFKARINAKTMYDAVIQKIRSDPSLLGKPASIAVQVVAYEICGSPPNP